MNNITYGNREGQYFTEWRFQELTIIAESISKHIADSKFHIYYDSLKDFHNLEIEVPGVSSIKVRFYKVFSLDIEDGVNRFPYVRSSVPEMETTIISFITSRRK